MEINFINVGYGDAILLKYNSQYGLIDGGSSIPEEFQGNRISLKEYVRKENIASLEFVIITHIHEDHVCGICELLDFVDIKTFYLPYMPRILDQGDVYIGNGNSSSILMYIKALNNYKDIMAYAEKHGIACVDISKLDSISPFGSEVGMQILEPSLEKAQEYTRRLQSMFQEGNSTLKAMQIQALERDSNDHSLVLRIVYDDCSCVLTADNCPSNWKPETFSFIQNENVLKLPHHGQLDAVNNELLKHIGVDYIVTSSSSDRRNDSSNPEVYRQLQEAKSDIKFLFTDEIAYAPFSSEKRTDMNSIQFIIQDKTIEVKM